VWILGDLADDDRRHGMGIVVEYASRSGKPQWVKPKPFRWDYANFAKSTAAAADPDETFDMTFAKDNAAEEGFNRWTINGASFDEKAQPRTLQKGKRYRLVFDNQTDDAHPVRIPSHENNHSELKKIIVSEVIAIVRSELMTIKNRL
jgi:FtsP/CotA-like multicopper oxidase with cupredoxin domain